MYGQIRFSERHCRYLAAPGSETSSYKWGTLLGDLGLHIPHVHELRGIVARGWFSPILRVQLPTTFYLNWESFPTYPKEGNHLPEDAWAHQLWALGAISITTSRTMLEGQLRGKWYRHVLDQPHDAVTKKAYQNRLLTGPDAPEPEPIEGHSHYRQPIAPWIDFYAYWQVYPLAEVIAALRSEIPLVHGADNRRRINEYLEHESEWSDITEERLARVRADWEVRAAVFDWLSRYRTLRGLWESLWEFRRQPKWKDHDAACHRLLHDLHLAEQDIEDGLMSLLELWHDWSSPRSENNSPLQQLLRTDIARAFHFLQTVCERKIDPLSAPWTSEGRRTSPVAELVDALPFENWTARRQFPRQASVYLKRYNEVAPQKKRLDEEPLKSLLWQRWNDSTALRRFCRTFHRLHEHYSGRVNEGSLLALASATPVEYLNLAALQAEQLLAELYLAGVRNVKRAPRFKALLLSSAARIRRAFSVDSPQLFDQELGDTYSDTSLDNLPTTRRNPFKEEGDFSHPHPRGRYLLRTFFNFAVARHYAAHHDCLDDQLMGTPLGGAAAEAIVVIAVICLLEREEAPA